MDIREKIIEVLEKGYTTNIGTVDSGGVWVSAVNYTFDKDLNLYWMSSSKVRHSVAIQGNDTVAGNVTVSSSGEDNLGIQYSGKVLVVKGIDGDAFKKYFEKKGKPVPSPDDPSLNGREWYKLTPTFVELIDQKNLGFKKIKLEL